MQVVLAYVSGRNQLDEAKLAIAAGGSTCTRVDADTVRAATGFPIGGVPPFGHATALPVFIDPDLLQYDVVWAAAGTWTDVFAITPDDLLRSQRRHRRRPPARLTRCRTSVSRRRRKLHRLGEQRRIDGDEHPRASGDDQPLAVVRIDQLTFDHQLATLA